jgi:minichromosome maintenance protein 10
MSRKMAGRKLIRLPQIKEKMATENLEETDWVTFGVILRKVTPQSATSVSCFTDSRAAPG